MFDGQRHSSRTRTRARSRAGRTRLGGLLAAAAMLALLAVPSVASADLLESFTAEVRDQNGDPYTQAGGHPYEVVTEIQLFQHEDPRSGFPVPEESLRDVRVDLPAGLIGNPQVLPKCTRDEINSGPSAVGGCPDDTQVGTMTVQNNGFESNVALWNMVPPKGVPAQFGFVVAGVKIYLTASVRPDGRLRMSIDNTVQALALTGTVATFWGVPADPSHDTQRGFCLWSFWDPTDVCPVEVPERPFLTNPTSCTGPVTTTLRANSWQDGAYETLSATSPSPTGCQDVPFDPAIDVRTSTAAADSPTGLSVDVTMPQPQDRAGIAQAHLRKAVVTLPVGTSINPAAADGLAGCTQAQVGLDRTDAPRCPDASKIGTVEIATPLLPEPLRGGIYQATPDRNPFDSLFAIYIVGRGGGATIKLAGEITPNPFNGRLTTTIDNAQQLPFTRFSLDFFGGPRAALATPATCGTKAVSARFVPWSGNPALTVHDSFAINAGPNGGACAATDAARPFTPRLSTWMSNPTAGASSPFELVVSRPDGSQEIRSIDATLPEGVSAVLRGTPRCAAARAAAGTCGAASRVGSVATTVGAGPNPFRVTGGSVYVAGPYKGAPLSLSIVVPARAGIFDLGTVVVRAAVFVDPVDAHLRVASDPIPAILEGVPLRLRAISMSIDKPGFMTSPTSCAPKRVTARVRGLSGAGATLAQRFQMTGCAALPFAPELTTEIIGGRKATKRSVNPGLSARLHTNPGDANIDRVSLRLPKVIFLDQANTTNICTRAQYRAEACPPDSIYGTAVAHTPLLPEPLRGNVYLRSSENKLPDLVADLNGIVDIDLVGRIDTVRRAIRTTFEQVPDVPVSDFDLRLAGGEGGLLVNSKSLCKGKDKRGKKLERKARREKKKARKLAKRAKKANGKQAKRLRKQAKRHKHKAHKAKRKARRHTKAYRSKAKIAAQNGADADQRPKLITECGGKGKRGGKHKGGKHRHFEARTID